MPARSGSREAFQYTTVEGKGTVVQAASTVDIAQFQSLIREAIAASQDLSLSQEK